jgi:RNA polymerase sigma-54 factor
MKVVRAIMEHQMDFLISGPGNLRSLTHIDIASELGIHESTVSRVASGKFIQTGWGIFEMKYFFVSRLRSQTPEGTEDQSSDRVRRLIRELVDGEDPLSPLSDEDIAAELRKQGTEVARRTVAKYRGLLHILPANKRKRINLIKKVEEGTV